MDSPTDAVVSARLDRVEALYWSDKNLAVEAAQEWLADLSPDDLGATSRRLGLVLSSVRLRRGEVGRSAAEAQQTLRWAVQNDQLALQSRCHRLLGSVFEMVGDRAKALEHAVAANDLLDEADVPLMRAAARLCLADALGSVGSYEESERRYAEARQLVSDDDATNIRYMILNNLAFTQFLANHLDESLVTVDRLIRVSRRNDRPLGLYAADTIGRIYLAVGRSAEAVAMLEPAMRAADSSPNPDAVAMCLVTLAEVYRTQDRPDLAQAAIDRCRPLCEAFGLSRWSAELSREQAETFAATGDYRGAFEAYRSYHSQFEALNARAAEARGRVLETMFQATEARRDSARYRALAERDPLTGLYNRRYVDEQLSLALLSMRDGGSPLAAAMIDLDHFKRINDRLSHDVGDEVLRAIGRILEQFVAAVPGGVAARMGGEEFLVVLPGIDDAEAPERFDDLRRSIADHDWRSITSGIPVTASIGVAVAPTAGSTRSALVGTADARLYLAKDRGRDRVVTSGQARC